MCHPSTKLITERDRLRALRETLASRRRTMSAAKLQISSVVPAPPAREAEDIANLSMAIARARSGLVQELVEVFNVVEVGGRPPIGGKAGTKGEWTIGDLILPVPGDIRRKPCPRLCCCGTVLICLHRISTGPYQRGADAHDPLPLTAHVLPGRPASVRGGLDGRQAGRWAAVDRCNQGWRDGWLGKVSGVLYP